MDTTTLLFTSSSLAYFLHIVIFIILRKLANYDQGSQAKTAVREEHQTSGGLGPTEASKQTLSKQTQALSKQTGLK